MLNEKLRLKSLEEFKEMKRNRYFGYRETPDGFSYQANFGRVVCTWQEEYDFYCKLKKAYIEKMTPVYEFFKNNKNQVFSLSELRNQFKDININTGTLNTLVVNGIIKTQECELVNKKGQLIRFRKFGWSDGQ